MQLHTRPAHWAPVDVGCMPWAPQHKKAAPPEECCWLSTSSSRAGLKRLLGAAPAKVLGGGLSRDASPAGLKALAPVWASVTARNRARAELVPAAELKELPAAAVGGLVAPREAGGGCAGSLMARPASAVCLQAVGVGVGCACCHLVQGAVLWGQTTLERNHLLRLGFGEHAAVLKSQESRHERWV